MSIPTTPSSTLENLATNLGSNSELRIMVGQNYVPIKGLTQVTPAWTTDVNKTKPYVLKGYSHATKTGIELTISIEGLEVPSDPGTKALCAYAHKLGNDGNAQFSYQFCDGTVIEFIAATELQYGQHQGPNSESTFTGTLHITGIPEFTEAAE